MATWTRLWLYGAVHTRCSPGRFNALRRLATGDCVIRRFLVALTAAVKAVAIALYATPACAAPERPPQVSAADLGASIDDVTVETYGVINAEVAMRYLSLRKGDVVEQSAVDRDYANLAKLAGVRTRLQLKRHARSHGVSLHWIVMGKWFEATDHPFYGDQPLTIPIEGFGWIFTSHPLDKSGANVSSYSQVALRAQLARVVYTKPLWVDAAKGREGDLIVNAFGARGVYRASAPITQDVYSWFAGEEAVYLVRATNGTQVEVGIRASRSTSAKPTYITAPSLYDTFYAPDRNATLEAGLVHGCPASPTRWFPPNCYLQYRLEGFDSIGGLGATTKYRSFIADAAQYNRIGSSTLVVHGAVFRTSGTVPTSALLCAYTFGYAKSTCGTDANLVQAEFRIADARPGPLKFILFTETASSLVRGGDQPFAPAQYGWRADSGVGVMYHGFRFNLAYGNQGGRVTTKSWANFFRPVRRIAELPANPAALVRVVPRWRAKRRLSPAPRGSSSRILFVRAGRLFESEWQFFRSVRRYPSRAAVVDSRNWSSAAETKHKSDQPMRCPSRLYG